MRNVNVYHPRPLSFIFSLLYVIFFCCISFGEILHLERLPTENWVLAAGFSEALNYSIGCWYFSTRLPFITSWTIPFNSSPDIVVMWWFCLIMSRSPAFRSQSGQTPGDAVRCETVKSVWFVPFTTLRLASCSFRALSSSLLARTDSSVFFLLSRLTFSSVSGALLFR